MFEALSNRPRHNNIVRYFGHDAHETVKIHFPPSSHAQCPPPPASHRSVPRLFAQMIMFEPCTSSLKDFVLNCQATAGDCEWRLSVQDAEKWTGACGSPLWYHADGPPGFASFLGVAKLSRQILAASCLPCFLQTDDCMHRIGPFANLKRLTMRPLFPVCSRNPSWAVAPSRPRPPHNTPRP